MLLHYTHYTLHMSSYPEVHLYMETETLFNFHQVCVVCLLEILFRNQHFSDFGPSLPTRLEGNYHNEVSGGVNEDHYQFYIRFKFCHKYPLPLNIVN